tara:strand:- start:2629 stop:3192 length:564 start_codon:yes stop_codon:yes gene_type:complete
MAEQSTHALVNNHTASATSKSFWKMRRPLLIKMAVTAAVITAAGYAFTVRYHIGLDTQEVKCIGNYSFFLVDRHNTTLERGSIYAFEARGVAPYFDEGTHMVKILLGVPGDHVAITEDAVIMVNGEEVATGLALAEDLGVDPAAFMGETVLKEGHYWFMGESGVSFDSRYWGTVHEEQVIGRAYPLI